ncbi:COG4315 family predicted lipoprotein [Arthrobacter sp. A5]|uniref:COG4315 family predicted lipoprotein n=1 Tax=Arthrobacter sp. A5 TaxID=576926 RepID=UPI003DA91E70
MSTASDLKTASTSLGTVVVDGKGMTVYFFDKDTPNTGKSACSAGCLAAWPAVSAASAAPVVTGVQGKVGTITRSDGTLQVTINGLPVYTYAEDSAAGDVKGQGVGGIWWAVTPEGSKVAPAQTGSSGY